LLFHVYTSRKVMQELSQNPSGRTVFRVRVDGLESHTTYYYKVDFMQAGGTSDGVTSLVNKFTTP
jgi:hypothetical protein